MNLNVTRTSYITKGGGKKEQFATGSQRDTQQGKTRYDLIPVTSLTRLADLYARGAEKYDDWNWAKGQQYSRVYASMLRHVYAWRAGERTEDHLAAVAWACMALMYFEDNMPEMDDLFNKED